MSVNTFPKKLIALSVATTMALGSGSSWAGCVYNHMTHMTDCTGDAADSVGTAVAEQVTRTVTQQAAEQAQSAAQEVTTQAVQQQQNRAKLPDPVNAALDEAVVELDKLKAAQSQSTEPLTADHPSLVAAVAALTRAKTLFDADQATCTVDCEARQAAFDEYNLYIINLYIGFGLSILMLITIIMNWLKLKKKQNQDLLDTSDSKRIELK